MDMCMYMCWMDVHKLILDATGGLRLTCAFGLQYTPLNIIHNNNHEERKKEESFNLTRLKLVN